MLTLLLALLVTLPAQDPHQTMNDRGAMVMGFDQDKTAHHFLLFDDGGAIEISVKDPKDTKNRDAIRAHLPHIAMMFGGGDFNAPMLVHDTFHNREMTKVTITMPRIPPWLDIPPSQTFIHHQGLS